MGVARRNQQALQAMWLLRAKCRLRSPTAIALLPNSQPERPHAYYTGSAGRQRVVAGQRRSLGEEMPASAGNTRSQLAVPVEPVPACHAGGHRSPKAPQIRRDIVGWWVIAPVHALLLLVLQTGNEPRVRDGYIGLSTRGHARARETRDKSPICRNNVIASDRPCPPVPPRNLHGKEGVDGSSPSEGSYESPATRGVS